MPHYCIQHTIPTPKTKIPMHKKNLKQIQLNHPEKQSHTHLSRLAKKEPPRDNNETSRPRRRIRERAEPLHQIRRGNPRGRARARRSLRLIKESASPARACANAPLRLCCSVFFFFSSFRLDRDPSSFLSVREESAKLRSPSSWNWREFVALVRPAPARRDFCRGFTWVHVAADSRWGKDILQVLVRGYFLRGLLLHGIGVSMDFISCRGLETIALWQKINHSLAIAL